MTSASGVPGGLTREDPTLEGPGVNGRVRACHAASSLRVARAPASPAVTSATAFSIPAPIARSAGRSGRRRTGPRSRRRSRRCRRGRTRRSPRRGACSHFIASTIANGTVKQNSVTNSLMCCAYANGIGVRTMRSQPPRQSTSAVRFASIARRRCVGELALAAGGRARRDPRERPRRAARLHRLELRALLGGEAGRPAPRGRFSSRSPCIATAKNALSSRTETSTSGRASRRHEGRRPAARDRGCD